MNTPRHLHALREVQNAFTHTHRSLSRSFLYFQSVMLLGGPDEYKSALTCLSGFKGLQLGKYPETMCKQIGEEIKQKTNS